MSGILPTLNKTAQEVMNVLDFTPEELCVHLSYSNVEKLPAVWNDLGWTPKNVSFWIHNNWHLSDMKAVLRMLIWEVRIDILMEISYDLRNQGFIFTPYEWALILRPTCRAISDPKITYEQKRKIEHIFRINIEHMIQAVLVMSPAKTKEEIHGLWLEALVKEIHESTSIKHAEAVRSEVEMFLTSYAPYPFVLKLLSALCFWSLKNERDTYLDEDHLNNSLAQMFRGEVLKEVSQKWNLHFVGIAAYLRKIVTSDDLTLMSFEDFSIPSTYLK